MKNIIPVIMFFIGTSIPQNNYHRIINDNLKYTIYLAKIRWHTGIVLDKKSIDTVIWPESNEFKDYKYLDVGWGDSAFYVNRGFNLGLAVKALFYPTNSVLRVEGFSFPVRLYKIF
jgi:hypothetical protein